MNSLAPFDAIGALRVLLEHELRFVIIGGFAARLFGSPVVTNDLDICYARDPADIERLASALIALDARLRGASDDVPFILDAETLRNGDHFTFLTVAGSLDCLGTPSGVKGYEELARNAVTMEVNGMRVKVAAIDDLIRMKQASGRPKDLLAVEVLGALREEIDGQGSGPGDDEA